jgi:CubicO group peptidase (beta-lactamase class C family)
MIPLYLAAPMQFEPGSKWSYCQSGINTASRIIEVVSGESFDVFVQKRIFDPLGMTRSSTTVRLLSTEKDVATPHVVDHDAPVPVPWRNLDNLAPAGAINSTALDMARWLRFLLNNGRWGTQPLLTRHVRRDLLASNHQTHLPDSLAPSTHFLAYGLGVNLRDCRGLKILTHAE